jgi:hypothetical protein
MLHPVYFLSSIFSGHPVHEQTTKIVIFANDKYKTVDYLIVNMFIMCTKNCYSLQVIQIKRNYTYAIAF